MCGDGGCSLAQKASHLVSPREESLATRKFGLRRLISQRSLGRFINPACKFVSSATRTVCQGYADSLRIKMRAFAAARFEERSATRNVKPRRNAKQGPLHVLGHCFHTRKWDISLTFGEPTPPNHKARVPAECARRRNNMQ